MSVCLYGVVKNRPACAESELGERLSQLAFCCRGLQFAVEDLCADKPTDQARRLARLAAGVADQSERLAHAFSAKIVEPTD